MGADTAKNMATRQKIVKSFNKSKIEQLKKALTTYLRFTPCQMEDYTRKKRFQPYLEAKKITDALRRFERRQQGFDLQQLTRGENKKVIRIYDPEKPEEFNYEIIEDKTSFTYSNLFQTKQR